jgi:hypothetical protein
MTYYILATNILETLAGLHSNGRPTNVRLGREMDISDRPLVYWELLSCAGSNGESEREIKREREREGERGREREREGERGRERERERCRI